MTNLAKGSEGTQMKKDVESNDVGIRGFDFVEFYVGSAKSVAWWFQKALGFKLVGYKGPETGFREYAAYYLEKNKLKFVITSKFQLAKSDPAHEIADFVNKHGDGVKRIAYEVNDVTSAFEYAKTHGAEVVRKPNKIKGEAKDYVEEAAIRIYDDTEIVFINYDNYEGIFVPGYGEPPQKYNIECEDTGIAVIDHIVGNVQEDQMDKWAGYFENVLGFETYVHFGPGDISTKFSALLSKVVRSKDNIIKNPINEPYHGLRKSQIQEYIEEYNGSGVQHIAIACKDVIKSIRALRKNGVEFLSVPKTYYDELRKHSDRIDENIDDLEDLGILCDLDKDGKGYLLQLFTKPIGDRPTFFFEFIQRKYGSESFGQGNFQSLFESIERDQALRGNL